jgi:hypothetical protein
MYRNLFWIVTLLFFAPSTITEAQQTGKVPRIGFLVASTASNYVTRIETFRQGMRELPIFANYSDTLWILC